MARARELRSSTATTRRHRLYEQFAGFNRLEPLVIADIVAAPADRRRPAARARARPRRAGAEAGRRPDAAPPRPRGGRARGRSSRTSRTTSRAPRTAARCHPRSTQRCSRVPGGSGPAVEALRLACRIDVDDLTGTTAGGVHLATMGGVWQALVFGFAGVRASAQGLEPRPASARGLGRARAAPEVSRLSGSHPHASTTRSRSTPIRPCRSPCAGGWAAASSVGEKTGRR